MDWSSENYPWLSLLVGFALVFVWGLMSLTHAYDRSLATVNDSFTQGFIVVDRLGALLDALARLSVDQEAFLSTGDGRFQDGVIESVETLTLDIDVLNSLAARSKLQPLGLSSLSRSIGQVLSSVAESDDIKDVRSRAAASAFFESQQAAISEARLQAGQLKIDIAACITDRIRSARGTGALYQDLLYGAPLAGCGRAGSQLTVFAEGSRTLLGPHPALSHNRSSTAGPAAEK
jgi:hypothetical protein